jgi:hypothetical protein
MRWVVRVILGGGENMLHWAVIFLFIALWQRFLDSRASPWPQRESPNSCFIFLVACLLFFIIGMTAGRRTPSMQRLFWGLFAFSVYAADSLPSALNSDSLVAQDSSNQPVPQTNHSKE